MPEGDNSNRVTKRNKVLGFVGIIFLIICLVVAGIIFNEYGRNEQEGMIDQRSQQYSSTHSVNQSDLTVPADDNTESTDDHRVSTTSISTRPTVTSTDGTTDVFETVSYTAASESSEYSGNYTDRSTTRIPYSSTVDSLIFRGLLQRTDSTINSENQQFIKSMSTTTTSANRNPTRLLSTPSGRKDTTVIPRDENSASLSSTKTMTIPNTSEIPTNPSTRMEYVTTDKPLTTFTTSLTTETTNFPTKSPGLVTAETTLIPTTIPASGTTNTIKSVERFPFQNCVNQMGNTRNKCPPEVIRRSSSRKRMNATAKDNSVKKNENGTASTQATKKPAETGSKITH